MVFTIITNNCLSTGIYKYFEKLYDNPFVASLFVNDLQYIKFCKNFNHYIELTPEFKEPNPDSLWARQNGSPWYKHPGIKEGYPVMYLGDIEIHWIHYEKDEVLEKYNRRLVRLKKLQKYKNYKSLFLLSGSDLMNDHEDYEKLVREFNSIPTSIFLFRYPKDIEIDPVRIIYFEKWVGTGDERDESHLYKFANLNVCSDNFKYILKHTRPIKDDCVFLYGDTLMLRHTNDYIVEKLRKMGNPPVYICTYGKVVFDYPNIVDIHYVNEPQDDDMIGKSFEVFTKHQDDMCINKCYDMVEEKGYKYEKVHKIRFNEVGNVRVLSEHKDDKKMGLREEQVFYDNLYNRKVVYSKFFDKTRIDTDKDSKIFLIPSVIHIQKKGRSYFSDLERLEQTLKQVKSIKTKVPNGKIVLLEMSKLGLNDLTLLVPWVDIICIYTDDAESQRCAHMDPNKNKGEVYVLKNIVKKLVDMDFSHCVKFGGRYWLSEYFDCDIMFGKLPSFRIMNTLQNCYKTYTVEPVIYSIPKKYTPIYLENLNKMSKILEQKYTDVERLLHETINNYPEGFYQLEKSQVCGHSAVTGLFRYI